jgi:hypothetical protein
MEALQIVAVMRNVGVAGLRRFGMGLPTLFGRINSP